MEERVGVLLIDRLRADAFVASHRTAIYLSFAMKASGFALNAFSHALQQIFSSRP
jgi:hypothetical protein